MLAVLVLALAAALPAAAQTPGLPGSPDPPAASEMPSLAEVRARRAEIERELGQLREAEVESVADEIAVLERIDRLLALQLGELQRGEAAVDTAAGASALQARLDHPPPYAVAELDAVLDELAAAATSRQVIERELAANLKTEESVRDQLDERGAEVRRIREQTPDLPAGELRLLELGIRGLEEQLALRRLQVRNSRRDLELQLLGERELEQLAQEVRTYLEVTDEELEGLLAELEERDRRLAEEIASANEQAASALADWTSAREQLEMAGDRDLVSLARAEARESQLDTAQAREEILSQRKERSLVLARLWKYRFKVLAGEVSAADLHGFEEWVGGVVEDLEREQRLIEAKLDERRLAVRLASERLAEEPRSAGTRRFLGEQQTVLEDALALFEDELVELQRASRLASRLRDEIEVRTGTGLGERLSSLLATLSDLWRTELFTVEEERPITVSKVVMALLLIALGFLISKAVSRRLGNSVFPRLGLASGAAAAFQTLVFYFLLVVFVLWALHLVNIPLTAFTVLGGVVAIGVGFGSQNIVNNFISGLIILAERPIKVGDLIEIDGVFGQVEGIGPRSSRVRSGDNTHIIVPNSAFLEKNVLNWTISDDVIRTHVDVGVAYGSPVENVAELLQRAVAEEPTVLANPAPEVLFTDFGDNALAFRAYFWLRVARSLDRHRAQSRLRFRIDALFNEAGIVIAFPQRDVHFDAAAPLEVRLLAGAGATLERPPEAPDPGG